MQPFTVQVHCSFPRCRRGGPGIVFFFVRGTTSSWGCARRVSQRTQDPGCPRGPGHPQHPLEHSRPFHMVAQVPAAPTHGSHPGPHDRFSCHIPEEGTATVLGPTQISEAPPSIPCSAQCPVLPHTSCRAPNLPVCRLCPGRCVLCRLPSTPLLPEPWSRNEHGVWSLPHFSMSDRRMKRGLFSSRHTRPGHPPSAPEFGAHRRLLRQSFSAPRRAACYPPPGLHGAPTPPRSLP